MRYLIAHAPHAPGRKESLERLLDQIPHTVYTPKSGRAAHIIRRGVTVFDSHGREHASIWARRIWEHAAHFHPQEHVCILNDDVVLADDFHDRIERAVQAVPDEPISLHCGNANVEPITGAWARCYHYSGPAVILPPGAAESLCEYVYTLPWPLLSRLNEDNVAIMWAWDRQRPFWYLLPSPVTHDTSVPSTLGYDDHPHRQPMLVGPERDPHVASKDAVPFVELPWADTRALRYRREVLRAGRSLCILCLGREAVVGAVKEGVMICAVCLTDLNNAAIAGMR